MLISAGSYEQSPSLLEAYNSWPETSAPVQSGEVAEERLRERLADAMNECAIKESGEGGRHGNACTLSISLSHGSCRGPRDVQKPTPHPTHLWRLNAVCTLHGVESVE